MRGSPPGRTALIAILLIVLASQAPIAWARGSVPDPLDEARSLFEQRRYQESLDLCVKVLKANPEFLDPAMELIKKIQAIQQKTSELAKELLKRLDEKPIDVERVKTLRDAILANEPYPTKEVTGLMAKIDTAMAVRFTQVDLDKVLAEARALADGGAYAESLVAYEKAFALYLDKFTPEALGADSYARGSASLDAIRKADAEFEARLAALAAAMAALQEALKSPDPAALAVAYAGALEAAAPYAALRSGVAIAGSALEAESSAYADRAAKAGSKDTSSYFFFAKSATFGLKETAGPEGILSSYDLAWMVAAGGLAGAVSSALDGLDGKAYAAWAAGDYAASGELYGKAAEYAALALESLGLWAPMLASEGFRSGRAIGKAGSLALVPGVAKAEGFVALAAGYRDLSSAATAVTAALREYGVWKPPADASLQATLYPLRTFRTRLTSRYAELDAVAARADAALSAYRELASKGFAPAAPAAAGARLAADVASLRVSAVAAEVSMAVAMAKASVDDLEGGATAGDSAIADARAMLDGFPDPAAKPPEGTAAESFVAPKLRYPSRALATLKPLVDSYAALSGRIKDYLAEAAGEKDYVAADKDFIDQQARAKALLDGIDGKLASASDLQKQARLKSDEAARARKAGDEAVVGARNSLAKDDFATADAKLLDALASYASSLELEADAELAAQADRTRLELTAQIGAKRKDYVIRAVRSGITGAQADFYGGSYTAAEARLLEADGLWRTVFPVDENAEISYWLVLVRGASSVTAAREIPATSPLYPEMSQMLALAADYYEAGRTARTKTDKLKAYDLAARQLKLIIDVFPNNKEARILLLKVQLAVDPGVAGKILEDKLAAARRKYDAKDYQGAYNDVLDLLEIKPDYPGLPALRDNCMYALKLKERPADAATKRSFDSFVARARAIYSSAERAARAKEAIGYLNQALALIPGDRTATTLKDSFSGIVALPVAALTAGDSLKLRTAKDYAAKEDYLSALGIIGELRARYPARADLRSLEDTWKRLGGF